MTRPLVFAYNPTSWDNGPIPGGMADRLIRPVLEHLPGHVSTVLSDLPQPGAVNVYYTFDKTYRIEQGPPDEISVFVSHGIADKVWRNTTKVAPRFDYVAVSGPAWTRKLVLQGMPRARILEVGYAKLDPVFQGRIPAPHRDGRIRVVWAPTHGGGGERSTRALRRGVSSWWHADAVLDLLPPSEFDVVVAPHPRHRPDRRSTLDEYVGADVVIADGGSTIYEAWALDLPVVFPTWLVGRANLDRSQRRLPTFEGHIYRERLGYHVDDPRLLARVVAGAAQAGIRDVDQKFIEAIFPRRYRGRSGRIHAEALAAIADGTAPPIEGDGMVRYRNTRTGDIVERPARVPRLERLENWERIAEDPAVESIANPTPPPPAPTEPAGTGEASAPAVEEPAVDPDEIPATAVAVLDWVGGDRDRAAVALEAERNGKARVTVVGPLEDLLGEAD